MVVGAATPINLNAVIDKIYAAAVQPDQWVDLLYALADVIDHYSEKGESFEVLAGEFLQIAQSGGTDSSEITLMSTIQNLDTIPEPDDLNTDRDTTLIILLRHFVRAIQIAQKLSTMEDQYQMIFAIVNKLPFGVAILDHNARVICTNNHLQNCLTSSNGLAIKHEKLSFSSESEQRKYDSQLESITPRQGGTTSFSQIIPDQNDSGNDLLLYTTAVDKYHDLENVAYIVFIANRKYQRIPISSEFKSLFGLTDKELDITKELAYGYSIKEIADVSHVSEHTVRNQVKSILSKTGVKRQSELVKMVFTNPLSLIDKSAEEDLARYVPDPVFHYKTPGVYPERKSVCTDDGRRIYYREYGKPDGQPLIHFHSVLCSSLELPVKGDAIAAKHGFRLIIPERPGFDGVISKNECTFLGYADDIVLLINKLALRNVVFLGYAAGGVYAMACAYKFPELTNCIALVSSGGSGNNYRPYKTMSPLYRLNNIIAREAPSLYRYFTKIMVKGMRKNPRALLQRVADKLNNAEKKIVMSQTLLDRIKYALNHGYRHYADALAREVTALNSWFGFDERKLKQQFVVWHGTNDMHIPIPISTSLTDYLENVECYHLRDEGHFIYYLHYDDILQSLSPYR